MVSTVDRKNLFLSSGFTLEVQILVIPFKAFQALSLSPISLPPPPLYLSLQWASDVSPAEIFSKLYNAADEFIGYRIKLPKGSC